MMSLFSIYLHSWLLMFCLFLACTPQGASYSYFSTLSSANSALAGRKQNDSSLNEIEIRVPSVDEFSTSYRAPNISLPCQDNMTLLGKSLASGEQWALKVLDSTAKPGSGILSGNFIWLGQYDQCMTIEKPVYYCLSTMILPATKKRKSITIKWGVCLPDACSEQDVTGIAKTLSGMISNSSVDVTAQCHTRSNPLDTRAILAISVISIIMSFVIFGTLYDLKQRYSSDVALPLPVDRSDKELPLPVNGNGSADSLLKVDDYTPLLKRLTESQQQPIANISCFGRVMLSFSFIKNAESLLNTRVPAGNLKPLHGIRFLSMSWVIIGHSFAFAFTYSSNPADFLPIISRWTFQAILSAPFSVDTFFFISGMLVSFLTLKEKEKENRINWLMFYVHRFLRLTPVYMLVLMVSACLSRYMSTGPMYPQRQGIETDYCKHTWWHNLLYINNLVPNSTCIFWSWYLANEMQFHLLSPLILLPFMHSAAAGSVMVAVFVLIDICSSAVISKSYGFKAGIVQSGGVWSDYMNMLYIKPYCRVSVYVIGMLAGYILYRFRGSLRFRTGSMIVGWIVVAAIALADVYGPVESYRDGFMGVSSAAVYNSLSRPAWAVVLAWLILLCCTGNAGPISRLLSWSGFIVLSRLTYCAYLVHPMIMLVYNNAIRVPYFFNDLSQIYLFLANLVMAYSAAFFVSLCFEAPFFQLEKAFMKK